MERIKYVKNVFQRNAAFAVVILHEKNSGKGGNFQS